MIISFPTKDGVVYADAQKIVYVHATDAGVIIGFRNGSLVSSGDAASILGQWESALQTAPRGGVVDWISEPDPDKPKPTPVPADILPPSCGRTRFTARPPSPQATVKLSSETSTTSPGAPPASTGLLSKIFSSLPATVVQAPGCGLVPRTRL